MAIIPFRRDWDSQPQSYVNINELWAPSAVWNFADDRELLSGIQNTYNAASSSVNRDGKAISVSSTASLNRCVLSPSGITDPGAGDFTVLIRFRLDSIAGYAAIGKWNSGGAGGTNSWFLGSNTGFAWATPTFDFMVEVGSTRYSASISISSAEIVAGHSYTMLASRIGTSIYLSVLHSENLAWFEATAVDAGITTINTQAISCTLGEITATSTLNTPMSTSIVAWFNRGLSSAKCKELAYNPWQIFVSNNRLYVTATSGATDLSGLAQSSTLAAGAITQTLSLTGSSIAISTPSGVLNKAIGLDGSAASISIANGVVTITTTLSGAGLVAAFASGAISQAMALDGSAQSSASASGGLAGGADLAGAAQAAFSAAGQINMTLAISGASVSAALAAADISVDSPGLSGAAAAAATATGNLSMAVDAAGAATGSVVGSGALASTQPLSGNAVAAATATGDLTVIPSGLSGNAAGAAVATGALFASMPISGAAPISVIGSGGLTSTLAVTGAAVSVATGSGDLTVGIGGLTGHALADALAGGSITLSLSLSASALMQAVAAAQLSVAYPYILPHGEYSIKRLTPRYSLKRAA